MYVPGSWLFVVSAVVLASLIILNLDKIRIPIGRSFLLLLFLVLVWNIAFMLELTSQELDAKLLFARIQFLGIASIPMAYVYLARSYGRKPLGPLVWVLMAVVPVCTNSIAWFVPLPNIFWGHPELVSLGKPYLILNYDYQIWFKAVLMPYTYVLLAYSVFELARGLGRTHAVYRNQILLLILGTLFPSVVNLLYVFDITPIPHVNMSVATFSITGLLVGWALFRYRWLDVTPVARDIVIETMSDALLVLDSRLRIIDFNKVASQLFGLSEHTVGTHAGSSVPQVLHDAATAAFDSKAAGQDPEAIRFVLRNREFEATTTVLEGIPGFADGCIILLHDVTEREQLYRKVREMAVRDSLTGVYNRGAFFERAGHLMGKYLSSKSGWISVLMIDIDHFKKVNDTYGHEAGDIALSHVARTCIGLTGTKDLTGRLGGDEFAVLLSEAGRHQALATASSIHRTIGDSMLLNQEKRFSITISIGVASVNLMEDTTGNRVLEDLVSNADAALYEAKNAGRNAVRLFAPVNRG